MVSYWYGVVAHLGERIAGSDEVESSSLFGSTIENRGSSESPLFMRFFDISEYTQNSVVTDFGTDFLSEHKLKMKFPEIKQTKQKRNKKKRNKYNIATM